MKSVMLLSSLVLTASVFADCTTEDIIQMSKSGFNKEQIDDVCAARKNRSSQKIVSAQILTSKKPSKKEQQKQENPNLESWYFKFGVGDTDIYYPSQLQRNIDTLDKTPGVSRKNGAVDAGVYFPLQKKKSVIGFNVNGFYDEFTDKTGNKMTLSMFSFSLSYLYYFKEIRDGFYLRGDVGLAKARLDWNLLPISSGSVTSKNGFGAALGGGYSFGFDGWGVSAEALFSNRRIESKDYNNVELLVSLMF